MDKKFILNFTPTGMIPTKDMTDKKQPAPKHKREKKAAHDTMNFAVANLMAINTSAQQEARKK